MQTQTGTRSRQKREPRCKAAKLISLTETDNPLFWLSAALKDAQQVLAMQDLVNKTFRSRSTDEITEHALITASNHLYQEMCISFKNAKLDGLLPLCWEGTRALDEVEVAA